jgi:xylulokinase
VAPGSGGVIFTPWLNGERTPVDDHTIRGGWHNLSLRTDRAEMVRAVLEGVAFNSRWLLDAVEKFTGRPFPWLNVVGGGGSSAVWAQIHADVMDRPIRRIEHPIRANARGAALLAGVALGKVGVEELGAKVPAESRTKIEGAVSNLEDKLKGDDKAAIEAALNNLMNAAGELQQAAGAAGAGATGGLAAAGGEKKDDVIDAEYEVTDDGKKS